MKIILNMEKSGKVRCNVTRDYEDEACRYPDIVEVLMCAFEVYTKSILENANETDRLEVHDYLTAVFTSLMEECFPEEQAFTLTDAAVFKAQDEIIEQALKEGKTPEEMVQEYNKKAEDYVRKARAMS